jgi:tetratricopeptide (TPR) repeat protein
MRKFILLVGACALGCTALARTQPAPDLKRVNTIWAWVDSRLSDQISVWFDAGDYPRCTQLLRFRASADPADYFSNTDLGWMLENQENYDEALATYIKFRRNNPKMPDGPYPEANFYFLHRAYSKIPPLLEPSIAAKPHPNSYRELAHSYERLGLLPDAKRVWKKLVADYPFDLTAQRSLHMVESKLGGTKRAGR